MPGYFLFSCTCKCVRPARSRRAKLGGAAPISQLINFIFTHLFLSALSDGRAAEVLARPQSEAVGTAGGVRGGGVGGSEPMDPRSLFIIQWKSSGESEHSVLSAHCSDTKQAGWLKALLHVGYRGGFNLFWGNERGNISIASLPRNAFPTSWPILFISSPVFYTSRQSANLPEGSKSPEVQSVKPRFKIGKVWQKS